MFVKVEIHDWIHILRIFIYYYDLQSVVLFDGTEHYSNLQKSCLMENSYTCIIMITYRTECWFIIRKISRLRFLDSEFYSLVSKLIIQRIPGVRSDSDGSRSVRDRCSRTASLISRRSLIRGSRYDAALWPREYKHSARNQLKKEKGESCGRERLERKKKRVCEFSYGSK